MRKVLSFMKHYKKETVLAPFFKLIESCFDLFVPLVIANIINIGIANKDSGYIFKMCGVLVLLAFLGLAFALVAQYFSARAAVGFAAKLRRAVFAKIQGLSYTELDEVGTSTLVTRMTSDINQIQNGVNLTLRLFLRSPCIVFGAAILAFMIDVSSALIFVVAIPLLTAVIFGIMLGTVPLYKKVQKKLDKVTALTRENLNGARVIRAFCRENGEIEKFNQENDLLNKFQQFAGKISAILNPATYLIINLAIIALIHSGAISVESGRLEQGDVVALYNYMGQILVELVKLASLIITITKAVACGSRIGSVLELESSLEKTDGKIHGDSRYKIEFDNVCFKYKNAGEESLTNISFKVKAGETVGIIGGTGSGKTTLINLIPHLYDASSGTVFIDGIDVKSYDPSVLRDKIGLTEQRSVLFKGTIRENLLWGSPDASDADIERALVTAQAKDIVESKEGGLDSEVNQGGKNFSGGQRQRLCIARALVKSPEILILDDSSSALDYATDAKLRMAIKNMPDTTVFIVSQRTSSIQHADIIIVLDNGEMCGIGKHEELLEGCEVYREIYDSQYKKEGE